MPDLNVLQFSDGKPGHSRLAEGILIAARRLRPISITRIDVRRPAWAPPRLLSMIFNGGLPPGILLRSVYGLAAQDLPRADLIISAGGDTLSANVAAAQLLKVPNIFYGSLRRFRAEDFSLVLTSYAHEPMPPRHIMTLKPSPIDPELISPLPQSSSALASPKTIGLLIGGDAGPIKYQDHDWERLFRFAQALTQSQGVHWIISNSRRTPATVSDLLTAGYPQLDYTFIDVRQPGSMSLKDLYEASQAIVCTADSSSMVSEAVWVRRPVVGVTPECFSLTPNEAGYRKYLEAAAWTRTLPLSGLTLESFNAAITGIRPLQVNPRDLLADILARDLPMLFPPGAVQA